MQDEQLHLGLKKLKETDGDTGEQVCDNNTITKDNSLEGLRIAKTWVMEINSPPDQVFPLLCPERERDWVDGWDYEMIYSESGYAEPGCIFKTSIPPEGDSIWIMADYIPDNYIRIIKTCPNLFLLQWSFDLVGKDIRGEDSGKIRTDILVNYSMTGLSQKGNEHIRMIMEDVFPKLMTRLEKSMNYYLNTKKKLTLSMI
jgi:hypothetical protein